MMKNIFKRNRVKVFWGLLIVLGIGLVAVLPFFGKSFFPTHDGEYHIIRFMEFDRMLRQGYWFPRWSPTINSGYGLPLFEFMYPLPNYVASCIHVFGVGFVTAFKYSSAFSYLLSLLFCFLWLKMKWGVKSAVIGTIAASFVPYWFVELYVRGSIGELWAITFLFLGFFSIEKRHAPLLTIATCLLLLSHNGLSLIFIPLLGLYTLYRLNFRWLVCLILGISLSSWFWLPAIAESKYMVGLNTVRLTDHFASISELLIPSWGTEFSGIGTSGNKMSFQIGAAVFLWIGYMLLRLKKAVKVQKHEILVVVCIMVGSIYLLLPSSLWIWQHISVLSYLQYPWRLLILVIPFTAWIAAFGAEKSKNIWLPILLACCSVVFTYAYTRGAMYEPRDDAYYQTRQNFTDGTSSMGNSLSTIWTPWKETRAAAIVTDLQNMPIQMATVHDTYLDKTFTVTLEHDTQIRLHILYFPGWRVYIDGVETPIDFKAAGTLDIQVPVGTHTIRAVMEETPLRQLADGITIVSLVIAGYFGILWYRRRKIV